MLIVGSGLAGLALARDLSRASLLPGANPLKVLDKARGVGGRAATRRWPDRTVDHGAQFFTARGERLEALTFGWLAEGWLKVWTRGFGQYRAGKFLELREDGHARYAPTAGMNLLGKALGRELEVQFEAEIVRVERRVSTWVLEDAMGNTFEDEQVVFNLPAPQLVALLEQVCQTSPHPVLHSLCHTLEPVRLSPTFTLMLALERDLKVDWKAAQSASHPIGWVSRDHTKRESGAPPTLVIHASNEWSGENLERNRQQVEREILEHTRELLGDRLEHSFSQLHRWRFATPEVFYPDKCFWNAEIGLGWCGDWCGTARVEGALESGWALAERILGRSVAPQTLPEVVSKA